MTTVPRLLIVDDDPTTLTIVHKALEGLGEVCFATSGTQALQIVAEQPIDLVLLDILMPEMDGFATCRALLQACPRMVVLFVTVANDTQNEIAALEVGGHDFISKPINPPVVRARVGLHLKFLAQNRERRRIEGQLRVSEELARRQLTEIQAYYDTAPVGLFVLDRELRFQRINQRLAQINGQPVAAHLGRTVRELLPALADLIEPLCQSVLATGEPLLNREIPEPTATPADGRRVWRADYYPLRGAAGTVIGVNGFVEDITERQQAEQNLRDSERRFRALFEYLPIAYQSLDQHGRCLDANQAMADLLGFGAPDELLGRDFRDDWDETTSAQFPPTCDALWSTGASVGELRLRRRDGSPVTVILAGRVQCDASGQSLCAHCVMIDISERRAMEQEICALNADLERKVEARTKEVHAANALLREREEGLQFVLEGSRLGAWDWNLASGEVTRNHYWAEMLGYTPQEVDDATTRGWLDLIHPDDRARAWRSIEDHLAGRTALHEAEYRMRTRDGDYRWILDRARIVSRDGQGRPLRMSGTQQDITIRKQTQQALEEGHQRLMTVLNAMDAHIYLADLETHEVLFMNQPLIQAFGQAGGRPCYRVLQGLDVPCHFCTNERLRNADGTPAGVCAWEFQNQLNHRWYDLRDCAVPWNDGRLVRLEIATDITERKEMELRLRRSEERLRLATEHAIDNIWTMGPDFRLSYVSPSIKTLAGWTVEEFRGLSLEEWLMPDSLRVAAAYFTALDERCASGLSAADLPFRGEIELRAKDGTGVWTEIIATPLVDTEGRLTEFSGVTRDIRERKRYEAQLREAREVAEAASAAKTAFLAHMSHEIRTPMSGIIGMAELTLRTALDERQRNYVQKIVNSAQSLLGILNDILDLSKIEADKLQIEKAGFELRPLIDKVIHLVELTAQEKHLTLTVDHAAGLGRWFVGDSLRITQVLINLLDNAVKFTAAGTVSLSIRQPVAGRLCFVVRDTGIGMTEEQRHRLFQAFSQVDGSTTRKFGGTGLGLVISKRLVELMGGEIQVSSEPGRGSCFSFEIDAEVCAPAALLPGAKGEAAMAVPPLADTAMPAAYAGQRLLLVEDNPINREIALGFLEGSGLDIEVAENGEQAVERCKQGTWDLILMDIQMPVMDGLEATRRIRACDPRVPIIALTANAFKEDIANTRAAGMDAHLSKPFSLEQLHAVLGSYLKPRPDGGGPGHRTASAVPETGAVPSADFPEIAGLDRERVIQTFGSNRALFLRLLASFAAATAAVAEQTALDLAAGERQSAVRRMHSLRGSAGQIGALELAALAGKLEVAIERDAMAWEAPLAALDEQVRALVAAIGEWQQAAAAGAAGATGAATGSGPPPLDPAGLADLRAALRAHNLKALKRYEALQPALLAVLGADRTAALGHAIRGLRVAEALIMLEACDAAGGRGTGPERVDET